LINPAEDSKLNLILSVYLSRSKCRACERAAKTTLSIWAIAIVPLQLDFVYLSICPPDSLDSPEYTPLELPTSRLYKPDFFFYFRRLRACRPLFTIQETLGLLGPLPPAHRKCHDLLIEPVGDPSKLAPYCYPQYES